MRQQSVAQARFRDHDRPDPVPYTTPHEQYQPVQGVRQTPAPQLPKILAVTANVDVLDFGVTAQSALAPFPRLNSVLTLSNPNSDMVKTMHFCLGGS